MILLFNHKKLTKDDLKKNILESFYNKNSLDFIIEI